MKATVEDSYLGGEQNDCRTYKNSVQWSYCGWLVVQLDMSKQPLYVKYQCCSPLGYTRQEDV